MILAKIQGQVELFTKSSLDRRFGQWGRCFHTQLESGNRQHKPTFRTFRQLIHYFICNHIKHDLRYSVDVHSTLTEITNNFLSQHINIAD